MCQIFLTPGKKRNKMSISNIFDTLTHDTLNKEVKMNRVKDYRTELSISQLALAKAIGVSRQTINMIENDKYNPSLDLCINLAKELNTDLNALFWVEEESQNNEK